MSQLKCPSCGLKIAALGAPSSCPRCRIRSKGRVELLAESTVVPESVANPSRSGNDAPLQAR
jgi:hypothetical protein